MNNKGGLAHVPTDVTGFGVHFTLNLLIDQGLMPHAGADDRRRRGDGDGRL